ncbi:hypothetical protein Taro_017303 [Colocasia esculenta]|uniref:Rhodanese domain-containing protein n=1 Tax=Colocasia esculenta TaxID=4460 RepID=A0A843UVK9_COLES|nr:hypothetical protein [Colocasia esculenta]
MAAAAAARRLSSRFSSPLSPSSLLKRLLLSPESPLISASRKPMVPRVPAHFVSFGTRSCSVSTEGDPEEAGGVPGSVPVRVAHELLQSGHRYLDVRSPQEFMSGHAVGATNIPYMFQAASGMHSRLSPSFLSILHLCTDQGCYNFDTGMTKNPQFLEEVSSTFEKDDEIIVGCRSGKRSLMAASDLMSAGFTGVTDIAGGYSEMGTEWIAFGIASKLSPESFYH